MNGGRIFATTNPDSPMHWLKKDFIDDNLDVNTFYFGLLDNPKLRQEEREFLQRQHTGVFYRRFIKGEWCLAEGAIFDFFDERMHTITRPHASAQFYLVGCDIGFTNPTAFTLLGVNEQASPKLWVEAEYYYDSKKAGRQKTDAEFALDLAEFVYGRNIKFIYIDPAAASFKVELRRAGIQQIPIRDANNNVREGIKILSSYLSMGDLKILQACRNLIAEVQNYCWDPKAAQKGEDSPIKRADHCLDSLRYSIFSYFGGKTTIGSHSLSENSCRTLGYSIERLSQSGKTYLDRDFDPRQHRF